MIKKSTNAKKSQRSYKTLPLDPYDSLDAHTLAVQRCKRKDRENAIMALVTILIIGGAVAGTIAMNISKSSHEQAFHDECLSKSPYFVLKGTSGDWTCERISYASKEECVADGREKTVTDKESGELYTIICQEDGTWTSKWANEARYKNQMVTGGYSCVNVTSHDYNWGNDMYCTAPDGSHFYTDYEGAEYYENL